MMEPETVTPQADIDAQPRDDAEVAGHEATLIEEDLLVEDVSIDGMCGVY